MDVCDSIGEQTTNGCSGRVAGEPQTVAQRLFLASIPHAGDQAEARGDGRLGGAKEEADQHHAGEALGRCVAGENDTPYETRQYWTSANDIE